MKSERTRHQRRSLRLRGFDYTRTGAYFVTICAKGHVRCFGDVVHEEMVLNKAGRTAQEVWNGLHERFPSIQQDAFVVMPNHVHGIICLVGAQFIAPGTVAPGDGNRPVGQGKAEQGAMNRAPTLGQIVRTFKAVATRSIRSAIDQKFEWQRNYYEHVIRDEGSLNRIREYILTNPLRWDLDRENPRCAGEDDFDRWLATFKARPKPQR